ncbi:interferon gamma receptor 2 [Hoplias malabaricus]|uniref:interferon gamma receptor 2 n=1 Tax=Hoplias malabaricus TaxID=27720 RepID=UPI0034627685
MDWKYQIIQCLLVLIIGYGWSTKLTDPKKITVRSSVLSWTSSERENNVTYTVQYNTLPEQEWQNVCGCSQMQFNFTAASEDFYGKIFRVRAETANLTSDWKHSEQVQCQHTGTCAPLFNLTLRNNKVLLWMDYKDKSLKEKFGGHITFKAQYWKETTFIDKQDLNVNGRSLTIEDLESGEKYCFQVEYLYFKKSYGKPSHILCETIPETSGARTLRVILSGLLVVAAFATFGICLYFVYKNYKKIKTFLQPPLDIPDHFHEFFSGEFSHCEPACVVSQDFIILVPEQIIDEEEGISNERND